MKPNDESGTLPAAERPFRVLILSGSDRRQYNCPGVDSKSRALMLRMAERLPQEWEIDYEDLGNVYARARIQSCNACVSTSMALCCWPCNCYEKDSKSEPDLLWNLNLYAGLDLADAWAIIGPINWYGPARRTWPRNTSRRAPQGAMSDPWVTGRERAVTERG